MIAKLTNVIVTLLYVTINCVTILGVSIVATAEDVIFLFVTSNILVTFTNEMILMH